MENVPRRSKPIEIPKRTAGRALKEMLEPIQVSLVKGTSKAGTDTPATLPIRYAKPM